MPIAEDDRDKTSLVTHRSAFRWIRMPLGLQNTPATFQRNLDLILPRVYFKTCLNYLDGVLIFLRKLENHVKHIDEVLTLSENACVSLKLLNCQFLCKILDYLGHVLLPGRITIAKNWTSTIADANCPQDLTQRRSVLGACNVYPRFIKGFSHMAEPLNRCLRKDVRPVWN